MTEPTPRTDAYPTKLVERSIDEALHPKGMSTHDGMVKLSANHIQHILAVSRQLEREAAHADAAGYARAIEDSKAACVAEHLISPTMGEGDQAYDRAVDDCIDAVSRLKLAQGGEGA